MNRLISIGLAIAAAPAILLAIGNWTESRDTIRVSEAALFGIALPLGGLLVIAGLFGALINRISQFRPKVFQETQRDIEPIYYDSSNADDRKWPHRIFDAMTEAFDHRGWFLTALVTLVELTVAFGVVWLVQYQIYGAVRRASGQELSIAGVMVSFLALGAGVVVATLFYRKVHSNCNLGMWVVLNIMAIGAIGSGLVRPMAQKETLRQKEVAALQQVKTDDDKRYAAWVEQLRLGVNHGPPGVVPPMLKVEDGGTIIQVQNIAEKQVTLALGRVRQDPTAPGGWKWCGTYVDTLHARLSGVLLAPGEIVIYRLYDNCAEQFKNTPIEYRVGGWRGMYASNDIGWWSDSAFTAVGKRE